MSTIARLSRRWLPTLAVAGVLGAGCTGCATNPATGDRELSLISESSEIQMGQEADPQIVAQFGLYDDESLQRYVSNLGQELAAVGERPELPWTFRVLDDPTVNAFAVPGGFVYITRGILSHLSSEAELAGVLGHEVGHITAKHSVNQMSKAQLTQLGLGLGMIFVPEVAALGDVAGVGLQLLFLKYGRDDELQADRLGVRYMVRTDYQPRELANVMAMLDRTSRIQESSGRIPEWLSTHPDPGNRVEQIQAEIPKVEEGDEDIVRRDEYIRRLDGMVFGNNPREGFFEGDVFHHPDLRFRLTMPSGWAHANSKQAVQAVAPDQDAALLLTLAQGTPGQALSEFSNQQGIRVGGASNRSVNGLPAATAEFAATTEQGTLVGLVMFVSHRETTYRVVAYAPEARWSRYDAALRASLGSFQPETDQQVLSAQPRRIEVVELASDMSFQAFMERYPSNAEAEVLALINGVTTDSTLRAGMLVKRVVGGT